MPVIRGREQAVVRAVDPEIGKRAAVPDAGMAIDVRNRTPGVVLP